MLCERKRAAKGDIEHHEWRLVARGDSQTYGVEYYEVWAQVARSATLRMLLARCAAAAFRLAQMDVETAFINGPVTEENLIRQPARIERGELAKVRRLRKALCGLKRVYLTRYQNLGEVLRLSEFKPSAADSSLQGDVANCTVFNFDKVDDLLIVAKYAGGMEAGEASILWAFEPRDLGTPSHFRGLHIDRRGETGAIRLGQRQYLPTQCKASGGK